MTRQYFADMPMADPLLQSLSAIVATSLTSMWPVPAYTPINAYQARVGQTYRLTAGGIWTWNTTGALTISPFFGTTTGGVALGASQAQTVPGTAGTNIPWFMTFDLVFRVVNNTSATQSTAFGWGVFLSQGLVAAGGATFVETFGGTSATVDTTAASGLCIGWTLSVSGSVTPMYINWQILN